MPEPPRESRFAGRGGGGGNFQRPEPDPRNMGGGQCEANVYNCADTPNPLPPVETLWIEEMTWMDVRDALGAGKTTAIIATGGVEPNGPWLVTGKHNYVLRANCPRIATYLGNALCLRLALVLGLHPLLAQALLTPVFAIAAFVLISLALTGRIGGKH